MAARGLGYTSKAERLRSFTADCFIAAEASVLACREGLTGCSGPVFGGAIRRQSKLLSCNVNHLAMQSSHGDAFALRSILRCI